MLENKSILITGSSGFAGTLTKEVLKNEQARISCMIRDETNEKSADFFFPDLTDVNFPEKLRIKDIRFSAIFHLAEIVSHKNILSDREVDIVINNHIFFIKLAAKNSNCVVYPLTATMLDNDNSCEKRQYCQIKKRVSSFFIGKKKYKEVYFPVIHPFIDSNGNLKKFINFQGRIPFFNLFSDFDNVKMPYMDKRKFSQFVVDTVSSGVVSQGCWYKKESSVASLCHKNNRKNLYFLSKFLKLIISFLLPQSVIIRGRKKC